MNQILQIKNLSKRYGKLKALDNFSLTVHEGSVFGILGPNGSGKTTTLGIVLDVIGKSSGEYSWFNGGPTQESRKKIGAILENPAFYPYLSAVQNLKIVATIKEKGKERIDEVLKQVGLFDRRHDAFKKYSLGMKQRLSIASALLSDPPVLILDEPTNGLDPQGIAEIRELIVAIAAQGKTIIMASHLLDEVQKVCTHFAVLKNGRKIYEGTVSDAMAQKQVIELAAGDMDLLRNALAEYGPAREIKDEQNGVTVKLDGTGDVLSLHHFLIAKGVVLTHLAEKKGSLEQKFLKILAESHD